MSRIARVQRLLADAAIDAEKATIEPEDALWTLGVLATYGAMVATIPADVVKEHSRAQQKVADFLLDQIDPRLSDMMESLMTATVKPVSATH